MNQKFYIVKYQFPFKWKIFLLLCATLAFSILFLPGFRKSIYRIIPVKIAAVLLNSAKIDVSTTSVMDVFEDDNGSTYLITKNKVVKYTDGNKKNILDSKGIKKLNKGKFKSLSFGAFVNGSIFAGDWNGGLYRLKNNSWEKVFSINDKAKIIGLYHINEQFILISSKGVVFLDDKFKQQRFDLKGNYIGSSTVFKNQVFVETRKGILKYQNEDWENIYSEPVQEISSNETHLILMTQNGALYLDESLQEKDRQLPGYQFTAYAKSSEYEVLFAGKTGIFVRKPAGEWILFPSPAKSKARAVSALLEKGSLWSAYYTSGFYKINLSRLMELEGME